MEWEVICLLLLAAQLKKRVLVGACTTATTNKHFLLMLLCQSRIFTVDVAVVQARSPRVQVFDPNQLLLIGNCCVRAMLGKRRHRMVQLLVRLPDARRQALQLGSVFEGRHPHVLLVCDDVVRVGGVAG